MEAWHLVVFGQAIRWVEGVAAPELERITTGFQHCYAVAGFGQTRCDCAATGARADDDILVVGTIAGVAVSLSAHQSPLPPAGQNVFRNSINALLSSSLRAGSLPR